MEWLAKMMSWNCTSTIVAMKSKQENMRKLSLTLQKEAEEMDGLIEVLEKDYQALKAKAER